MDDFMEAAVQEARLGFKEKGIPIGSVLVLDGKIIGRGRNQRNQKESLILHAEMDAIENAGILPLEDYKRESYILLSHLVKCVLEPLFIFKYRK